MGSDALCWSAGAHADRALIHKIYKQILRTIKKEKPAGAREMAHWLRALAALSRGPGFSSRTHMEAHNHL